MFLFLELYIIQIQTAIGADQLRGAFYQTVVLLAGARVKSVLMSPKSSSSRGAVVRTKEAAVQKGRNQLAVIGCRECHLLSMCERDKYLPPFASSDTDQFQAKLEGRLDRNWP